MKITAYLTILFLVVGFAGTAFAGGIDESIYAYDSEGRIEYMGEAVVGASTADAVWRIKKIIYDVDGNIQKIAFADNNPNKEKIWDDRETYSYE